MEDLVPGKYNISQLRTYIKVNLGSGLFAVELTDEQLDEAVMDALNEYGKRQPIIESRILQISPYVRAYPLPHDAGYGVFDCQFITDDVTPAAVFYMGLLGGQTTPLNAVMLAEYDAFLRYRKTMMRATSVAPDWAYEEDTNTLFIYAPVFNLRASYSWHAPRPLSKVRLEHQGWIRSYSLAKAKLTLGKVRSKFSGVLPGPARDLQLNGENLQSEAREEIKVLEAYLLSVQGDIPPLIK